LKELLKGIASCFGISRDPKPPEKVKSTVQYSNGDVYNGEMANGMRNGYGVLCLKNEERYQGQWRNNMKQGQGYYYYANGEFYKGNWEQDKKEGYGEFYFLEGKRYIGDFKNDQLEGKGTLFFKNKSQYNGHFKAGKRHGKGIFKDMNGTYFEEVWDMNVQIAKKEMQGTIHLDSYKEAEDSLQPMQSPVKGEANMETTPIKLPESESEVIDFNDGSPLRGDHHRLTLCRNSRVGNETLSLQEFKENLGSFENKFEDVLGKIMLILQSNSGILIQW
jgi:hypothetical protein